MLLKKVSIKVCLGLIMAVSLLLTVSAGEKLKKEIIVEYKDGKKTEKVIYRSENGIYEGMGDGSFSLENINGDFITDLEIDQFMARVIADTIFRKKYGQKFLNETRFSVIEAKDKDIFIVDRVNAGDLGKVYNIAIDKKTGQILKMWSYDFQCE